MEKSKVKRNPKNDSKYYSKVLENINKTIGEACAIYPLHNNGEQLKKALIDEGILKYDEWTRSCKHPNEKWNMEDFYYKKGTYTQRLSHNEDIPPLNFLLGFCKFLGINFDDMINGTVNFLEASNDSLPLLLNKFTRNNDENIFYLYFPESKSKNDRINIIHESKLEVIPNKNKGEFDAKLQLYLSHDGTSDKFYQGKLTVYNNQTVILNLKNTKKKNDYMIISLFNKELRENITFWGTAGYKIAINSENKAPSITSCVLSSINIKKRIPRDGQRDWYQNHSFKSLFTFNHSFAIISKTKYKDIINCYKNYSEYFGNFASKIYKNLGDYIYFDFGKFTDDIEKYGIDYNTSLEILNKIKLECITYNNSQSISLDINKRVFKYIQSLGIS